MVLEKKSSARVEAGQRRVLDEATRQRRLTRQLEALEKDNFQDDPLSSLPPPGPTARLPAFSETEEPEKKRRKTRGDHFKQRFRKNFTALLEEENLSERPEPNYLSAAAPPSSLPPPSLLLRVRVPLPLHLQHLRGAVLQLQVSEHAQRNQVSEVDALTPCRRGDEGVVGGVFR
uniref:Zinc finger, HIT-type containing 1 n=1 Tax=Oryzias latipes TaxID=8090 RepID=A0A3P9H0I7_ORYLA